MNIFNRNKKQSILSKNPVKNIVLGILIIIIFLLGQNLIAQVGIGNTDPKATLDITVADPDNPLTTDGILVPRVNTLNTTGPNSDQDGMLIYLTADVTILTILYSKGFYYWDDTASSWIKISQGNKNTLDQAYDEGGAGAGRIIDATDGQVRIEGSHGLYVSNTSSVDSDDALYIRKTGSGTSQDALSIEFLGAVSSASTLNAINNRIEIDAISSPITGLNNLFIQSNNTGYYTGVRNYYHSVSGASWLTGAQNDFISNSGSQYGVYNNFIGTATNNAIGLTNTNIPGVGPSGVANYFGVNNIFRNNTNGRFTYGVKNEISGTGDGEKYGTHTEIPSSAGGLHYGVYSNVQNSTGYAGYFIGRTSLGTGATNRYLMPETIGTTNQIMAIDNTGQVNFVDASSIYQSEWTDAGTYIRPTDGANKDINIGGSTSTDARLNITTTKSRGVEIYHESTTGSSGLNGIINNFNSAVTSTGSKTGFQNITTTDAPGSQFGFASALLNDSTSDKFGFYNYIETTNTNSSSYGIRTTIDVDGGTQYGIYSEIIGGGNSSRYGVHNSMHGSGSGPEYGVYNNIYGSGTGDKYGTWTSINPSAGGIHYGIRIDAQKANSYAAYFIGRTSLGIGITNRYLMPETDGSVNQIMTTDGSGQVNFVDASSIVTEDADWYVASTTASSNDINDNIYTLGRVAIGGSSSYPQRFRIENSSDDYNTSALLNTSGSNTGTGLVNFITRTSGTSNSVTTTILNSLNGTTNGSAVAIRNNFSIEGLNSDLTGVLNYYNNDVADSEFIRGFDNYWFNSSLNDNYGHTNRAPTTTTIDGDLFGLYNEFLSPGSGIRYGVRNNLEGTGNGAQHGVYNYISNTGNGDKYASFNRIITTAGGTHYGIYSDVQNSTGYAGYFLGRVRIGSSTTAGYLLPTDSGVANQVLTSNGSGSTTWQTPTTGDITGVTAGAGFTGGGTTGTVSVSAAANNGLNVDISADHIQLGGPLTEDTAITYGTFDTRFNLDDTGDFIVQDNGSGIFQIDDAGVSTIGRNMIWKEGNIIGTTIADLTDDNDDGLFRIYENGTASILLDANGTSIFNEQGLDRDFRVESDDLENMLLVDAGNNYVGIAGDPDTDFHVFHGGSGSTNGLKIQNRGTNDSWWRMYTVNSNGNLRLYSTVQGTASVGNFNDASGVYSATSDRRLKKDFKPLPFSWQNFMDLETLSYLYKSQEDDKRSLGLIAQDVDLIYPELVSYNKEDDIYHMNYSGFGVIAIKAVQELKQEVDTLVDTLKKENTILKAKLNKLESIEARLTALENTTEASEKASSVISKED